MAAEQAQPSDLDHAQQRLAGLEADLRATLEEAYRLSAAGEHDAAVLALDAQSGALDAVMEALARDVSGLSLAPPIHRARRKIGRWVAAALAAAVAITSVVLLSSRDPLSDLATRIDRAEATTDPQARLAMIEDAYESMQRAPARVVAQSALPERLANAARDTASDLEDESAPRPMQVRAAIIAANLERSPDSPMPSRADAGSPTEPVVRAIPRG